MKILYCSQNDGLLLILINNCLTKIEPVDPTNKHPVLEAHHLSIQYKLDVLSSFPGTLKIEIDNAFTLAQY